MKYFVVGYYGYNNIGDDDLLRQTIRLISIHDDRGEMTVALGPLNPIGYLTEITVIPRFSIRRIVQHIRQTDIVVFGGGSLFQDHSSARSMIYYASIVFLAHYFQKKIAILAHGFSRPETFIGKFLLKYVLNTTPYITCRDSHSVNIVNQFTKTPSARLSTDLAFWGRHVKIHAAYSDAIMISARPCQSVDFKPLEQFVKHSTHLIGLCFNDPLDRQILIELGIANEHILSVADQFPNLPPDASPPRIIIAMRYHACVLAALNGIPFLAIGYDDKVISLAEQMGQPVIDLRRESTVNSVLIAVETMNRDIERYRSYLIHAVTKSTHLSCLNTDLIKRIAST